MADRKRIIQAGDRVRVRTDYEGTVTATGISFIQVRDSVHGDRKYQSHEVEKIEPSLPTKRGAVIETVDGRGNVVYRWMNTSWGWRSDVDKSLLYTPEELQRFHMDEWSNFTWRTVIE